MDHDNSASASPPRQSYWSRAWRLTSGLFFAWLMVTFVSAWFAREFNRVEWIGPMGFYMAAQGALLVYLLIVWIYARCMDRLDAEMGAEEEPR